MTRTAIPFVRISSYLVAVGAIAASVFASIHLLFPLARAVNCFQPRESTWLHAIQGCGWSIAGVLGVLLAMGLAKRATSIPGVRAFILWCESVVGLLLVVPILFLIGPVSRSAVEARAECGLHVAGAAAIAAILLIPILLASLPALLSFSKLRMVAANLIAVAATVVIWAAAFAAVRPWEYPGH